MPSGAPSNDRLVSLRGPEAANVGHNVRRWFLAAVLLVSWTALIVSFISTAHDNSRIERMKFRGVPVSVTVTRCTGNIGGSGSNAAGFTCAGGYTVAGTTYHELIGSMTTFARPGTELRGVADPSKLTTVVLSSALSKSEASLAAYIPAGLILAALIGLTTWFIESTRRRAATPAPFKS